MCLLLIELVGKLRLRESRGCLSPLSMFFLLGGEVVQELAGQEGNFPKDYQALASLESEWGLLGSQLLRVNGQKEDGQARPGTWGQGAWGACLG